MPKYCIMCAETRALWLEVEAPNREAARKYYDGSDCSEFNRGDDWEYELVDIAKVDIVADSRPADIAIDENGEELE